jgi:hypothetical protein
VVSHHDIRPVSNIADIGLSQFDSKRILMLRRTGAALAAIVRLSLLRLVSHALERSDQLMLGTCS